MKNYKAIILFQQTIKNTIVLFISKRVIKKIKMNRFQRTLKSYAENISSSLEGFESEII